MPAYEDSPAYQLDGSITNPDLALFVMVSSARWMLRTRSLPIAARQGQLLAALTIWMHGHLMTGGILPTLWAADSTSSDDTAARPVTDLPLPPPSPRLHFPAPNGRCIEDGGQWPCDPVLAAWVRDNTPALRQAFTDAAFYCEEHQLPPDSDRDFDRLAGQLTELCGES